MHVTYACNVYIDLRAFLLLRVLCYLLCITLYYKQICETFTFRFLYLTSPALETDPSTVFEPHLCSSSVTSFYICNYTTRK